MGDLEAECSVPAGGCHLLPRRFHPRRPYLKSVESSDSFRAFSCCTDKTVQRGPCLVSITHLAFALRLHP